MMMDRFPVIIYIGVAVLGRVAGEMIISDPFIVNHLHPNVFVNYSVQIFFTAGVLIAGWIWFKKKKETVKIEIRN
jgi:predicted tellurium resistance membrane protein TerC